MVYLVNICERRKERRSILSIVSDIFTSVIQIFEKPTDIFITLLPWESEDSYFLGGYPVWVFKIYSLTEGQDTGYKKKWSLLWKRK